MEGELQKGTGGFLQPKKVIEQFNLKPGASVAHFGCGHGYFTIPMAQIAGSDGKIYAIDVLDEALQTVKAQTKIYNLENIELIRANLELAGSSRIENNSIDLVLLANVLFQSQKKEEIIKEAKRVLKEEGKIIIIDWDPAKSKLNPRLDIGQDSGWRLGAEEMQKLAENEGLVFEKKLETGEYHYGMVFRK